MRQEIRQMYRAAIARMDVSADADIERLRRTNGKARVSHESTSPYLIAHAAGKPREWGEYAFTDLRSTGFIINDWSKILWFRPTKDELDDAMDQLAGLEAAAIIRLGLMDCKAAMPVLNECLAMVLAQASQGCSIEASLAHQRLMLAVVAATGEERLMEEYGKRAKVALAYAMAERLGDTEMRGMQRSARLLIELLCSGASRECAAAATAMRIHPGEPVSA